MQSCGKMEKRRFQFMKNKLLRESGIRLGILAASIAMIAVGVSTGEPGIVLQKAVRICLKCIGIG